MDALRRPLKATKIEIQNSFKVIDAAKKSIEEYFDRQECYVEHVNKFETPSVLNNKTYELEYFSKK